MVARALWGLLVVVAGNVACDALFRDSYPCNGVQSCAPGDACSERTGTCFVQPSCGGTWCAEEQVCEEPVCRNDTQWAQYRVADTPDVEDRGNTLVDRTTGLSWAVDGVPASLDAGCPGRVGSVNDVLSLVTLGANGAQLPAQFRFAAPDGGTTPQYVVTGVPECPVPPCPLRWAVAVGNPGTLVTPVDRNACMDCWQLCVVGGP